MYNTFRAYHICTNTHFIVVICASKFLARFLHGRHLCKILARKGTFSVQDSCKIANLLLQEQCKDLALQMSQVLQDICSWAIRVFRSG